MNASVFKRDMIIKVFERYWPWLVLAVCMLFATGFFRTLGAQYVQVITDHIQTQGVNGLWPLIWITCLIQAVNYSTKSVAAIACMRLTTYLTVELRVKLMQVFHRIDFMEFEKRQAGDLQSVLHNDTGKAADYVYMVFSRIGTSVVTGFFTFLYMARINLKAAAAVFAVSVWLGYVNNRIIRRIKKNEKASRELLGSMTACFTEGFEAADSIKIYGAAGYMRAIFGRLRRRYNESVMNVESIDAARLALYAIVNNVTLYGSIVFLSWQALKNAGTLGNALAFITLLSQALISIEMIFRWSARVAISNVSWERIAALATAPSGDEKPSAADIAHISSLRVEGLDFSYDGSRKILKNLSFSVEKGKVYRIPGESGSGKTTLIKCLLGLYNVPSMRIWADGAEKSAGDISKQISFVPSEHFLFMGSIYDNITLGEPLSHNECLKTADEMGIGAWLRSLPDGLDTQIETAGENFSGGQRQALCILRAFLSQRSVIILDEPFSSLDKERVTGLMDMLDSMSKQRLVIVTTHNTEGLSLAEVAV